MDLGSLLQYLITGVTVGATYGLTGLGFTIIFNTTGIINFAQGEFVMLGGMLGVAAAAAGLPLPLAVLAAVAAATLLGALMERAFIRPVAQASAVNLIIITIGVAILIRGAVMLTLGKDTFALPHFSGMEPIRLLGAAMLPQSLWVLGVTLLLLLALKSFFSRTMWGRGMLACSFDPRAAALMGINVSRMAMASFMISAAVGAAGGVILAPITLTSYDVGILLGLKGFAACILGGLGNPFGAAAGGVLLGVLETFGAGLLSSAYKDAITFVILLLLLFVRPTGLFGKGSGERV